MRLQHRAGIRAAEFLGMAPASMPNPQRRSDNDADHRYSNCDSYESPWIGAVTRCMSDTRLRVRRTCGN